MKTFKHICALLIIFAAVTANSFAGNNDETEVRKVQSFHAIKVSTGIDLYLKMGDKEEVKIVADGDIIDDIKTEVKDGTLHIYTKQNNWFNWGRNNTKKAYVRVTELSKLRASSGSDVRADNTLKGESLEIKVSSGSDVYLDVIYKNLSLDSSSGSDARLKGKVKNLKLEASSGSDIKARELESVNCEARASSGSDIIVTVSEQLNARASSGADIRYYGNPQQVSKDESSGGDVNRR
jgi:hypothetical protein